MSNRANLDLGQILVFQKCKHCNGYMDDHHEFCPSAHPEYMGEWNLGNDWAKLERPMPKNAPGAFRLGFMMAQ